MSIYVLVDRKKESFIPSNQLVIQVCVYKQPWFREAKFLVYCRVKSSEAKFMNKVKKVFSGKLRNKIPKWMSGDDLYIINNAMKSVSPLLCGYGNWGRNPNLKNNAIIYSVVQTVHANVGGGIETLSGVTISLGTS